MDKGCRVTILLKASDFCVWLHSFSLAKCVPCLQVSLIVPSRKMMNWLRLRKATQPDNAEDGVAGRPQWDADYRLQAFPAMGMFEEYLEMGWLLFLLLVLVLINCYQRLRFFTLNKVNFRTSFLTVCYTSSSLLLPC